MIKNFIDIFVITVLLTLSIYHIMIYWGRKNIAEEKYNLFFSIFSFAIALYILLFNYVFAITIDKIIDFHLIAQVLEAVFIFGIFYGFMNFLAILLEYPKRNGKVFISVYLILLITILLSLIIFIKGYQWYMEHLLYITGYLYAICFFIISTVFIQWIIKNKLYKARFVQIIFIGYLTVFFFLFVNKIIILTLPNNYFTGNKVFIGIIMFIFAYTSANKFNNEYYELKKLKENLENKVKDRTIKLEDANRRIEESAKQKTTFFINLVHETKTPLTLIKNSLDEFVRKNPASNELKIIKQNIDKLIRDMVNFLDSQKLEHGQTYYDHNQEVNISEMISEKIILFQKMADKKNIKISGDNIEEKLFVLVDPYAIDRVINNLLDNSIKYTKNNGSIEVTLKSSLESIFLSVADNGIGIKKEQQKHIFTPYFQMSHEKRSIQGIGIGLFIVKKIIDSLKGNIDVCSEINKGTIFTIKLKKHNQSYNKPVFKNENYSIPIDVISILEKVDETEISKDKLNIFVVEDNIDLLNYFIRNIQKEYNFYYAINGIDAIEKIKKIPRPDIIISDIMMDEMDGYKFCEEINKLDQYKDIPFIFLTAKTSLDEKIKGLSLGAIDFITKPFSIEELKVKIESILLNKKNQRERNIIEMENKIFKVLKEEHDDNDQNKKEEFDKICNKYKITVREKEVIENFIQGLEYKEIGYNLNISGETIKKHIQNIFRKCDVKNRVEFIRLFSEIL